MIQGLWVGCEVTGFIAPELPLRWVGCTYPQPGQNKCWCGAQGDQLELSRCFSVFLSGKEFPNSFESLVKKICKYLFHVLAHIYSSHFKETLALELHGHLNTLYTHFILFIREFNLVDPKETTIMDDLTEVLCSSSGSSSNGSGNGSSNSAGAQNHVKERWALLQDLN